jgi:glycine/D-amino acid oxidase-like deaminating enzyme
MDRHQRHALANGRGRAVAAREGIVSTRTATAEDGIVSAAEILDTPLIAVDETVLHRNIAEMAALAASHGVALRPHAKTHKSPHIAGLQLATGHGAWGVSMGPGSARRVAAALLGDTGAIAPELSWR